MNENNNLNSNSNELLSNETNNVINNTEVIVNNESININEEINTNNISEEKENKKKSFSVIRILLVVLFLLAIFIIICLYLFSEDFSTILKNKLFEDGVIKEFDNDDKFKGELFYDANIDINDIFVYNIPSEFIADLEGQSGLDRIAKSETNGIYSTCSFELNGVLNSDSSKKLSKEMANYYGVEDKVDIKTINHIEWDHFKYNDGINREVYLTEKDSKVYVYEYRYVEDDGGSFCEPFRSSIIESISFKEGA